MSAARAAYQKFDVDVAPSAIDGLGVFAAEAIRARLKIGEIRGESISVEQARIRATRTQRIMIVELSTRRAIDFSKSGDPMRYTNHSCRPNARLCIRQGRVEFRSPLVTRSPSITAARTMPAPSPAAAARRVVPAGFRRLMLADLPSRI